MPTKDLSFNLVADADGKVSGSHDETPLIPGTLQKVMVRSTSDCNNRNHPVKAGFSGGATFNYDGQMTDCSDLEIEFGDLPAPGCTVTTLFFELPGFNPQEEVSLEGKLTYSLFSSARDRGRHGFAQLADLLPSAPSLATRRTGSGNSLRLGSNRFEASPEAVAIPLSTG